MANNTEPSFFATLKIRKVTKLNTSPGFTIVFDPEKISEETIQERKTEIELALNQYLEENVDTHANNLHVPFTNKIVVTKDPMVYSFNAKASANIRLRKKAFIYPPEPLARIDGFVLELAPQAPAPRPSPTGPHHPPHPAPPPPPSGSHVNTVTIKPPPSN